jgi:hypothetical protein
MPTAASSGRGIARRSRPAHGSGSTACGSGSFTAGAARACSSPATPGWPGAAANIGRSKAAAYTRLWDRTTVPVFILVPQVTVRKRLDVDGAARKWIRALPQLVLRNPPA